MWLSGVSLVKVCVPYLNLWPLFPWALFCPEWSWPVMSGSQKDCWVLRTSLHLHTCSTTRSGREGESVAMTLVMERSCVVKPGHGFTQKQPKVKQERQGDSTFVQHQSRTPSTLTAAMFSSILFHLVHLLVTIYGSLCSPLQLSGRSQMGTRGIWFCGVWNCKKIEIEIKLFI